MAKKSRKTKAKTSDFQKTKLKVGKKRPLPSNVTEVAFKSQAIYVAEQMKNVDIGEGAIQGKEAGIKRNIPELLSQVGHFNKNFRVDSLTSLRNSFAIDKNLLRDHLPKVFAKAPHSIRDDDQQVRKSSIAFFKCVFSGISREEMAPFFDALLLHLFCAMTHIYDDVKKDSLQIFDLCIKYFPDLLTAASSDKLLQHFIDLISTKQTRSAAKEGQGAVTRVLSMKLSGKESSIVWRNRILERLYSLLNASGESRSRTGISDSWQRYMKGKYDGRPMEGGSPETGVIMTKFESMKFKRGLHSKSLMTNTNTTTEKRLSPWELVTTLVPLLIDTWHEATSDESKQFSDDSVMAMTNVLKITNILLERFISSHDNKIQAILQIHDRCLQDFQKYFFDSFPIDYAQKQTQPNPKRRKTSKNDVQKLTSTVHSINLSICEMITTLFPNELIGERDSLLASVAEHLSMLLVAASEDNELVLDETGLKQSIAVTKALLNAAMDEETTDSLLHPLLTLFHCSDTGSAEKVELLKFFSALYSDFHFPRTRVMDQWVCSLPIVLADIIHGESKTRNVEKGTGALCSDKRTLDVCLLTISTMRLALVKENMDFVSAFCEKSEVILEILKEDGPRLFCLRSNNVEENQSLSSGHHCINLLNRLFELFLHPLCDVTIKDMKDLVQICHMEYVPAESVNYAASIFLLRYERYGGMPLDLTSSVQFASSIVTGIARCNLQSLQSSNKSNQNFKIVDISSESQFSRHAVIVDKICSTLGTVSHIQLIMRRFFMEKILHTYQVFPDHSAFAIVRTVVQLSLWDEVTSDDYFEESIVDEFIFTVGKLISAIFIHCHGDQDRISLIIRKGLNDVCVTALKLNCEVLRACIRELGKAGCEDHCDVVCQAIDFMMSQSELRENLNVCKSELDKVLDDIKVANPGESSTPLIESTMFGVSATLSSAS